MLILEIYLKYWDEVHATMMNFIDNLCGSVNYYQSFLLGYSNVKIVSCRKKTTKVIEHYENDFGFLQ